MSLLSPAPAPPSPALAAAAAAVPLCESPSLASRGPVPPIVPTSVSDVSSSRQPGTRKPKSSRHSESMPPSRVSRSVSSSLPMSASTHPALAALGSAYSNVRNNGVTTRAATSVPSRFCASANADEAVSRPTCPSGPYQSTACRDKLIRNQYMASRKRLAHDRGAVNMETKKAGLKVARRRLPASVVLLAGRKKRVRPSTSPSSRPSCSFCTRCAVSVLPRVYESAPASTCTIHLPCGVRTVLIRPPTSP